MTETKKGNPDEMIDAMLEEYGTSREAGATDACSNIFAKSEATDREQRRIGRLLAESGLPEGKTLGNLDEALLPVKIPRQLPALLEGGFVSRSTNILAGGLLRAVEFAKVKHVALQSPSTADPAIFKNAPVDVLFAVFESLFVPQEHDCIKKQLAHDSLKGTGRHYKHFWKAPPCVYAGSRPPRPEIVAFGLQFANSC